MLKELVLVGRETFHSNKLLGYVRMMLPGRKKCRGMSRIRI